MVGAVAAERPGHLAIHLHGGLISREAGEAAADRLESYYRDANAVPFFLVWESGWREVLEQRLAGIVTHLPCPRPHYNDLTNFEKISYAWQSLLMNSRFDLSLEAASMIFRHADYGVCVSREPGAGRSPLLYPRATGRPVAVEEGDHPGRLGLRVADG